MLTHDDCVVYDAFAREYQAYIYPLLAVNLLRRHGRRDGRILDLGTGPGFLTLELAARSDAVVTGLDINPKMLELTDELLTEAGVRDRVVLQRGDVHALPFADSSFDLVASYSCLHHWADIPRALAEVSRVLAPGGRMVILDTEPLSPPALQHLRELVADPAKFRFVEEASEESLTIADVTRHAASAGLAAFEVSHFAFEEEDILDCIDEIDVPLFGEELSGAKSWVLAAGKPAAGLRAREEHQLVHVNNGDEP